MTDIRAVIFDMDGCLVDSETMSLQVLAQEMATEGVHRTTDELRRQYLGVSIQAIVAHIAKATDREMLPDFAQRFEDRLLSRYDTELRNIEGIEAVLDALRAENILVAIATGSSVHRLGVTMRVSGLSRYFTGRAFSADQVKNGKPAPDLFLLAAESLSVPPEACAVMEDSPHGVTGAVAAGMRAIGFVGGSHLDGMRTEQADRLRAAGAALVLSDLTTMRDALLDRAPA